MVLSLHAVTLSVRLDGASLLACLATVMNLVLKVDRPQILLRSAPL